MGKLVGTCGGFDPIHIGHVRLFIEAKKLAGPDGKLVILLNNDNWLTKKKGKPFMPEEERKEILLALEAVDEVIISSHPPNPEDMSMGSELEKLHPDIFAKGGDRRPDLDDIPSKEHQVCEKLGIEVVWNVGGGKVQSSSWLIKGSEK